MIWRKLSLSWFFPSFVCLLANADTVWIDTDVSIGSPFREVDDAFALVLAFHSPEMRVAGISTTYGNARLKGTTNGARTLAQRFGSSAGLSARDVYVGASGRDDLSHPTAASTALARALQKQKLTYIALGPLTNLATFVQLHPRLVARIERVIFVGGTSPRAKLAFGRGGWLRIHDANVRKDPAAARVVIQSSVPLMLFPIETASQLLLDAANLQTLRQGGAAGDYLFWKSRVWRWFWEDFVGMNGGPIFDALPMVAVARPDMLVIKERHATVDEKGRLIVTPQPLARRSRRVRACTAFAAGTKDFVVQRLRVRHSQVD